MLNGYSPSEQLPPGRPEWIRRPQPRGHHRGAFYPDGRFSGLSDTLPDATLGRPAPTEVGFDSTGLRKYGGGQWREVD